MAQDSKIQWTEATWNPWHGCTKVSAGCKYCYMYRDKEKYGQDPTLVVRSKTKFNDPLKWKDDTVTFTCSWSDWFISDADDWRAEAWNIVKNTPHITYQILTKRADRILQCLPDDWGDGYPNVWLGVTVEDNDNTWRIDELEKIKAVVRFISFEPLLENLTHSFVGNVDWIIIGGESGNENGKYRYRPCEIEWMENIIEAYTNHPLRVTSIFVKQLGTHLAKKLGLKDRHGGDINAWPEHLRVREFPHTKANL